MKILDHIKYSAPASVSLIPFIGLNKSLVFFISSLIIDIDHWIDYIFRFKNASIKKMINYYGELFANRDNLTKKKFVGLSVLHTVEFFIFVYFLSLKYPLLVYVLWGFVFHLMLDVVYLVRYKIQFIRAYSIIEYLIRIKTRLSHK